MSFVDGMVLPHHSLTIPSLKAHFGVEVKSEAMGENKNGEAGMTAESKPTAESLCQGLGPQEGLTRRLV